MTTLELDLPLIPPDIPDTDDRCVTRLESLLVDKTGIERAHLIPPNGGPPRLCLHYDPEVLTLAQVERYAHSVGIDITGQYGHAVLPIRSIDGEDAGPRIEANLPGLPGVLAASVSVPAVLVATVLVVVVPFVAGFWAWQTSLYRGLALLVAASPCALALGTPSAVLAGIAQAARRGVLIKGGAHLENLGTLRARLR